MSYPFEVVTDDCRAQQILLDAGVLTNMPAPDPADGPKRLVMDASTKDRWIFATRCTGCREPKENGFVVLLADRRQVKADAWVALVWSMVVEIGLRPEDITNEMFKGGVN